MGAIDRFFKPPLWLLTIVFVPATLFVVWFGTQHSTWLQLGWSEWTLILMGYCAVASITPMWLLMQPRGYLGGFVLYGALVVGVIGIFFGGYQIEADTWHTTSALGDGSFLFPFLFVTIACGACSGFHGLVCSGTTSKQIDREGHCHSIGYGAMLLEGFVALIALATVMIMATGGPKLGPGAIYSQGLGRFITLVIGDSPEKLVIATTFGAMALSTFIFDTLDSATRLGRYVLQELFGAEGKVAAVVATLVTCGVPILFLRKQGSFGLFWKLFGTSNQLLAALTLLAISVWLYRGGGRKPGKVPWFTAVPMVLVMAVTVTSLVMQARDLFTAAAYSAAWINGLVSVVLLALAATLIGYGAQVVRRGVTPVGPA